MFPCKYIHKYTGISLDGKHKNQIDHVLVGKRFKNEITNVQTLHGAAPPVGRYNVGGIS